MASRLANGEDRIQLIDLQGQCELNYYRLEQVFPDMRVTLHKQIFAGEHDRMRLRLEVSEHSPYTTRLWIRGELDGLSWIGDLDVDVHMYHDAKMAEVTHANAQRLLNFRNRYPNALMMQRDEKWHANQFLGVWLDFFLQRGHA